LQCGNRGDLKANEREDTVTEKNEEQGLTPEELEEQNGEKLPDREVMSLINPGVDGIASTAPFEPVPPEVD
jgi:hypothetical protein